MAQTIYLRMKASKDSEGNWQPDENAGWRFIAVPSGKGRRPKWLEGAEKSAAKGGRGFQFRVPTGNWSTQFSSVAEARTAAESDRPSHTFSVLHPHADDSTGSTQTVRAAVDAFLLRKSRKSPATVKNYTHILNEFLEQLPRHAQLVGDVNPSVMEKFVSYLESADAEPKTVHNKVLVVALMLKFAGVKNPSKMVELEAVEDAPVEPYRAEDLKRLFDKMGTESWVRYQFFLDTACREGEVQHAQWDDIDWGKSEYVVRAKEWIAPNGLKKKFTPKSHQSRRVPLSQKLLAALKKRNAKSSNIWIFPNGDDQPEGHFLRKFKKIAFEAGLNCGRCVSVRRVGQYENKKSVEVTCATTAEGCAKHFLHRLRKTRATFWHENGVSLRTIQHWLGHKSLETTMKYLGVKDSVGLQKEINLPMY